MSFSIGYFGGPGGARHTLECGECHRITPIYGGLIDGSRVTCEHCGVSYDVQIKRVGKKTTLESNKAGR